MTRTVTLPAKPKPLTVSPDDTALIVVDMQNGYCSKGGYIDIEGLSVDAEVQTLDRVREHIKNTVAEANLGQELHDSDLDVRLKKLQQQGGDVSARAQLEEMKKARAAQGVGGKQM
jgi:nicotinamidase-related amidase